MLSHDFARWWMLAIADELESRSAFDPSDYGGDSLGAGWRSAAAELRQAAKVEGL